MIKKEKTCSSPFFAQENSQHATLKNPMTLFRKKCKVPLHEPTRVTIFLKCAISEKMRCKLYFAFLTK